MRASILAPITALVTVFGAFTVQNSVFDVVLVIVFGFLGYLMKKFGFEPGPLVLAFVLGSLLETSVRQSLRIFGGDPTGFVTRPVSGGLLALVVALVVLLPLGRVLLARRRGAAGQDEQEPVGAEDRT